MSYADILIDTSLHFLKFGMREAAIIAQLQAMRHDLTSHRAHVALAESLLARGDYPAGFREWEHRAHLDPGTKDWPEIPTPTWNGMHLPKDGRLLIVADQGFGDTLMFSRYLPWVAEHCSELHLGCSPEMVRLMSTVKGVTKAFSQWAEAPGHVMHARLSSLPCLHGTTIHSIPMPPILSPPKPPDDWNWFLQPTSRAKVGLCWRGREENDAQKARSVLFDELTKYLPHSDMHPIDYLPLHKEPEGFRYQLARSLIDWADTAAVVACLDLVVTSDTAIAHLAGTLGIPCFVMLKHVPDWRWGIDTEATPWYPGLRLFRQQVPGRWESVLRDVGAAVIAFCEEKGASGDYRLE